MNWNIEKVRSLLALEDMPWEFPVFLKSVDSTNSYIRDLYREGGEEGCMVIAETQSRGRGRFQRSWFSPPGSGIWMSILLRPVMSVEKSVYAVLAASLSVLEAVEEFTGKSGEIKWPNDILFSGKKIAGILAEKAGKGNADRMIALGLGLNVNQETADFPDELRESVTSCRIEMGRDVEREFLFVLLVKKLWHYWELVQEEKENQVFTAWISRCASIGRRISVETGRETISGIAERIDESGILLLRTDDGNYKEVSAGDSYYGKRPN